MKYKLCVMALLCHFFSATGQTANHPKYLMPGQQMPDLTIENIINTNYKSAKISDFRGKVLLLDFWCTTCSGCVASFPELDSLQRLYKEKLQLLLVDSKRCLDTEKMVRRILNVTNAWSKRRFKVPIVMADAALTGSFEFRGVPFIVWIDPNGKLIAFTGKPEVTPDNINRAMAGKRLIARDTTDKRIRL